MTRNMNKQLKMVSTSTTITLQEKIMSGNEKVKSMAILESLLQSGIPLFMDLIHRSLRRNQPVLFLSLEFSAQQWKSWLKLTEEETSRLFFLELRTLFHNFENDPREFFDNLLHYVQTYSFSKKEDMSSPFLPPLLLMDSIDTLVTEDLLPFLRFAAGLKNYSFFFCFSPSLHPSSHLLAIQHFTQGYVQLIPLPRKHSMIDAKDIWSQSKNVHVQLSQCRCEVYLKRPRGKWVNEINGFELHEKKSHVSLETKHSSFLHSSPSDSNASFSTTTTSTATSSSTSMWSSTILPYQEEVEDGNQLHDPYFMEPKPRDPSSLFTQPSINKPSESLLNTMDPEGWKRTALQPQEIQLEPPPPNKTHGPSPPTFPSTSSSSSSSLPFDLEGLTFDLSLTPRQKEARAQVKLPFLEAQSDSGFIHYAYDINDDFDDDDPDADLEF